MPYSENDSNNFNIERHIARTEAQLELMNFKLKELDAQIDKNDNLTDKVREEINALKSQVATVSNTLNEVKEKTDALNNNVFLRFTSEITSQKLITILLIISTAISSPTIITSWLNGSLPDQESERIDRLINLLQENAQNP